MRILLLADNLWAGGKERRLMSMIKGFSEYPDVQLHLVVFSDRIHFQEVFEQGIPVTILKRTPKWNPMVLYRLFNLCRKWKPDLVHSWSSMSSLIAIPTCILLNRKLINGNIADAPKAMKIHDRRMIRARITFPFSKVVVGNSQAGLIAYKVPENKRICIYNGFDTARIAYLQDKHLIREKFQIKTEKVVGMVGSFSDNKDYKSFIEAAMLVAEKRDDVSFIAVGGGPGLAKFKQHIPPESASYLIFTGLQKDVESVINVFDIGVLATNTRVHGEGISNAILEYMALGKPTIATMGGGTNETVDDGNTGFLVPPSSSEKIAETIHLLLDNEVLMKKMGEAGKKRLESVFGIQKMIRAYYQLYQDVSG